jgi:hypothetical protein
MVLAACIVRAALLLASSSEALPAQQAHAICCAAQGEANVLVWKNLSPARRNQHEGKLLVHLLVTQPQLQGTTWQQPICAQP